MDLFKTTAFLFVILLTFQVYGDDDSDVSVSVSHNCEVRITDFQAPGNGSGFIGQNTTGYFNELVKNTGTLPSNLTVEYINVTDQNSTWEPGDPLGEQVKFYNGTNFSNVSSGGERLYTEDFNATYDTGWYTARTNVAVDCMEEDRNVSENTSLKGNDTAYVNFKIIDASGNDGGVNTSGNQSTNETVPEDINSTGNQSTNETVPEDINQTGNQSTNETMPQDADEYGEESDQTIEGDNDNPGQTPVPEPEPEPEPDPRPRAFIEIHPVNRTYDARQGQFSPAALRVENVGNDSVNDIQLMPELEELHPDWGVRGAEIANLSAGENVTRDVFIQPTMDQSPGEYVVPVRAENEQAQLDLDYFTVNVLKSNYTPKVEILEAPRSVSMGANTTQPIPVLIENTGERELNNITAEFQNLEDCGTVRTTGTSSLEVNGTDSLNLSVHSGDQTQTCNATLVVSSVEGAYAFSDVEFTTTPEEGLIPREQRVPFLAIAWTFVLAAYAVMRKRYELNSSIVKVPFLLLLMGETLIILYMLVNYYGFFSVSFLPF